MILRNNYNQDRLVLDSELCIFQNTRAQTARRRTTNVLFKPVRQVFSVSPVATVLTPGDPLVSRNAVRTGSTGYVFVRRAYVPVTHDTAWQRLVTAGTT